MAKGTRAVLRNKDDEIHSSRKISDARAGMSNASNRAASSSGSKQLAKGASGQTTSSPLSTRKSERLEKRMPPTTPITRKSVRLVKHSTPSPLRRSDRGKNHCSSSTSGSNHSGKSFSSVDAKKKKEKKEKSIKQITMESGKVVSSEKYVQRSSSLKRKRMDARSYKSLFKAQKRRYSISDSGNRSERQVTLPRVDNIESGVADSKLVGDVEDGGHKCDHAVIKHGIELLEGASGAAQPGSVSDCEDIDANISGNGVEAKVSLSRCEHDLSEKSTENLDVVDGNIPKMSFTCRATLDEATRRLKDYSSAEILKIPDSVTSTNMKGSSGSETCSESTDHSGKLKSTSSTRNIMVAEKEFGKDVDGACLPPVNLEKHDSMGSCVVCYKKRRLTYDSPEEELCSCPAVEKDTGNVEPAFSSESVQRYDHVIGLNETLSNVQTDNDGNVCVKCKQPGELLHCYGKGCKRCYHLSCLDPILYDAPPGVWHCSYCTKKKIESGIYTVTKGVESIWDAREVVVADSKGTRRQKQYLVKYQGLAHAYNHWIPESRLLLETPDLVTKYNENNKGTVWNWDWTVPNRLLRKRPLISLEQDNCSKIGTDSTSDCEYEWLVKWRGLDYAHATWEVENATFLQSPQRQKLIREYGIRYEKAKRVVEKSTKGSFVKLQRLLAGGSTLSDECYLHNVNKLRELWYKNQNAVVFDEQERFANVIFFILSLSNHHQPFLITSTSESLSQWEAEFLRLAPSVDVVVYKGNIETRSSIRALEFHEEDKDGIMLQVLLSPIEVVLEDLQFLKWLKWKVIVIDECQRASPDLKKMKLLDTDMRLLLFSGPVKDTVTEYSGLVSLLGSPDDLDKAGGSKSDTIDNLVKLKENFSRFTAYSRFVEYLVPVEISNLQLEQYCATLLANVIALRSNSKTDEVGAFREILMTLRKCCDHPYIVDSSLQPSIIAGLPPDQALEVGIKASGKLQLLYEILSKIRDHGLRALVLFQSIVGSLGIAIGDILDDFVRGKFGQNSYERIDACLIPSKKQAALNKFNEIGGERFVFLLENRACQSSIKLSVDAVIIFDSEWNPSNDLKALQRLSIHARSERINVFRLYSSCTIEEKVLILGKQNHNLESNLQNIRCSSSLLMWGASCLFSRLDEYHAGNSTNSAANISSGHKLLCDVISEISAVQSVSSEKNDKHEPIISRVFRSGGTYNTSCPLLGEKKVQLTDVEEPHIFWKRLLEGKNPRWRFAFSPSPRCRKRVQYAEESSRKSETANEDAGRKRKKVGPNPASVQLEQEENQVAGFNEEAFMVAATNRSLSSPVSAALGSNKLNTKDVASSFSPRTSYSNKSGMACIQVQSPSDEQKSLHAFVKAEIEKLCKILKLSKQVEQIIDRFLDYVMENHQVNKEPASILQAFQMSVCWTAASILKQKIDRKDSLGLAKRKLNFKCTEEQANSVYLKLRLLKKPFLQLPGTISGLMSENFEAISSRSAATAGKPLSGSFDLQNVKAKVEVRSSNHPQAQEPNNKLTGKDLDKKIKKIQKKCDKRMSKLHLKHKKEIEEFHKVWAEKKEKLVADHRNEVIFVRAIHGSGPLGLEKLKISDTEFAKKMAEHEHLKALKLKELVGKHCAATEDEREKVSNWEAQAESCRNPCRIVNEVHIRGSESEDEIEFCKASAAIAGQSSETDVLPSGVNIEEQGLDAIVPAAQASDAICPNPPVALAVEAVGRSIATETAPIPNSNSKMESETGGVEASFAPRAEQCKEDSRSSQGINSSEKHVTDGVPSTAQNSEMPSGESGNAGGETGHANFVRTSTSIIASTSEVQIVSGNAGFEMGHDHAVETSTPARSSVGNDGGNIVTSDITRHQKDQLDCPSCDGMTNTELLSVDLTDSLPPFAVECQESMVIQDEDRPDTGNQITTVGILQCAPLDAGTNSLSNCEEVTQQGEQLEQASDEIGPDSSQSPAAQAAHQGQEDSLEVSHQPVSQDAENMVLHPPVELLGSEQGHNHPDSATADGTVFETNSTHSAHSHSLGFQVSQNASRLQLYAPHRAASWNTVVPSHAEPLQNELERIQKEIEQAIKLHDSTKLQLKTDCEKEIEEMAAQIRKKYEEKHKDAETAFMVKKTELESKQIKVLMNKILAEAFRSKCLDIRPSGISSMQQVVPSSFMQHLHQLPLGPSMRHSPVNSQRAVNPSVQSAHRSSGNFSGLPTRPPQISAITPTIVNARVGGEVRAPAPHLQPFRPAGTSSTNMSSLPCNPNLQVPVNVPVVSPLLPSFPPQQALLMSSKFLQPNPSSPAPRPTANINQSGSGNQLSESEAVAQPCPQSPSPSALELLRNVHNQPSGHAPNTVPCSPCSGSHAGAVDLAYGVVCLSDDDE